MLSNARWAVSSIAATILLRRNLAPYASKPLLPALAVEHEPFIYSGNQRTVAEEVAVAANAENTTQQHNATDGSTQVTTKEERGDVMVSHFWQRQRRTVFDTRITDADGLPLLPQQGTFGCLEATREGENPQVQTGLS